MKIFPWLLILAMLGFALWTRYVLMESTEFAFFCAGGGGGWRCALRWFVVQNSQANWLGYFSVFLGLLATITRSGLVACPAGIVGVAGLVFYNGDYSAVGFLLGALALARAQAEEYGDEHGTCQEQT